MLRFGAKVPGLGLDVRTVTMDFTYGSAFQTDSPDAYETLILDALLGDASLFTRADEVEEAWSIVDPIVERLGRDAPRRTSPTTRPARGAPRPPTTCSPARGGGGGGSEPGDERGRRPGIGEIIAVGSRPAGGRRIEPVDPPTPGEPTLRWASRAHTIDEIEKELGRIWARPDLTVRGDGERRADGTSRPGRQRDEPRRHRAPPGDR